MITKEIKADLKLLYIETFIMVIISFLISLFWGFDLSLLIGFLVGYLYSCFSLFHMGYTVSKNVTKEISVAKRSMNINYAVRYVLLAILAAIAILLNLFSPIGLFVPVFFPRIAIGFNIVFFKGRR